MGLSGSPVKNLVRDNSGIFKGELTRMLEVEGLWILGA
jgi:hypothetical protein